MIRQLTKYITSVVLGSVVMLLFAVNVANAAVFDSLTVSPLQKSVALGRANSLNATWTITGSVPTGSIVAEYESARGEFRTNTNVVLGTVYTPLPIHTVIMSLKGTPYSTVYNEALLIPSYVLDSARKLGLNQIRYVRIFTGRDTTNNITSTAEGNITLNIGSSSGGSLQVSRLGLSFTGGGVQRVTGVNTSLQAQALLDTQGTGLFRAVWEIAEPSSTLGEPSWRILQQVQRSLSGSQELAISSPRLPTRDPGLYFVRLRIQEPSLVFSEPLIQYVVQQGLAGSGKIELLEPQGLVTVGPHTRFSWHPVDGAQAYRLDVYTQELRVQIEPLDAGSQTDKKKSEIVPGKRVAGVLVKPDKVAVSLSHISLSHLQQGRRYFWQVQAFDKDGRVIATSSLGEIVGP